MFKLSSAGLDFSLATVSETNDTLAAIQTLEMIKNTEQGACRLAEEACSSSGLVSTPNRSEGFCYRKNGLLQYRGYFWIAHGSDG